MAWRYTFDDGPERDLPVATTLYSVAAMSAFAREEIRLLPMIVSPGIEPYDGHVVTLWDDELLPTYRPTMYGLAYNQCGTLTLPILGKK